MMKKSNKPVKKVANHKKNISRLNSGLALTFSVAMFGVIVGVLGALGFVGSYLHNQLVAENSSLSHQIDSLKTNLSIRPASYVTSSGSSGQCSLPATTPTSTTSQPSAAIVTASAVTPTTPMYYTSTHVTPTTPSKPVTPFVQKLINGQFTTTGTISNTGPQSTNAVTTTNTATMNVTNDNNIKATSNNAQSAKTGNATVTNNTTSGSATTGNASNTSNTKLDISVNN
jgi:hypothetical protein